MTTILIEDKKYNKILNESTLLRVREQYPYSNALAFFVVMSIYRNLDIMILT